MRLLGGRQGEIDGASETGITRMVIACLKWEYLAEKCSNYLMICSREPEECSSECETEAEEMEVDHKLTLI